MGKSAPLERKGVVTSSSQAPVGKRLRQPVKTKNTGDYIDNCSAAMFIINVGGDLGKYPMAREAELQNCPWEFHRDSMCRSQRLSRTALILLW